MERNTVHLSWYILVEASKCCPFLIFKNRTDPKGSEHGKLRLWSKFPLKVLTTGEILYVYQSYHFHAWSLFLSLQVWEEIDGWDKREVPRLYLLVLLFLFHSKITMKLLVKSFGQLGLATCVSLIFCHLVMTGYQLGWNHLKAFLLSCLALDADWDLTWVICWKIHLTSPFGLGLPQNLTCEI